MTRPSHRAQHRGQEEDKSPVSQEGKAQPQSPAWARGRQEEDKAWTQSPATERVQGRGQEEDKA